MRSILQAIVLASACAAAAQAETVRGCASASLDFGDSVRLVPTSQGNCAEGCESGDTYLYLVYDDPTCSGSGLSGSPIGAFCSNDQFGEGSFTVSGIGSGCASWAQGCVRLTRCD